MRGAKADLKGVDVNVAFGERTSSSTYRSFGFGAALLGAPGSGKLYLGALKKDMGGLVFHASVNKHYFSGGEKIPVWQFLTSIPFSVGNLSLIHISEPTRPY